MYSRTHSKLRSTNIPDEPSQETVLIVVGESVVVVSGAILYPALQVYRTVVPAAAGPLLGSSWVA